MTARWALVLLLASSTSTSTPRPTLHLLPRPTHPAFPDAPSPLTAPDLQPRRQWLASTAARSATPLSRLPPPQQFSSSEGGSPRAGEEGGSPRAAAAPSVAAKPSTPSPRCRGRRRRGGIRPGGVGAALPDAPGVPLPATLETEKGSEKDQAVEEETERNVKSKLSKEGNATATQNDDTLANGNGEKTDKEASTGNQNGGTGTEEDTHEEDAEKEAGVQGTHRSFDELQNLYPCLAGCVERIKAQHSCGETLAMAFGFIGDEEASALESKIIAHRVAEARTQIDSWDIKKELLSMLIGLDD
ncbi:hypothetical protein PR202_ga22981 [Eleusine coracana subsp. coracana]|uniref:Uncharacterized protein n=1 Tax=Eleusine coracana subsp. coracana TaxID=191504 RepID=A0AAV5D4N2_ELECO|nr:hypothetical protein PR202_ga22981 [Eleusine coracana subsp. coracana]